MGWSDMEFRCKEHPSHRQSKGVCPYCLRKRLAHLSAASSSTTTDSSSSRATSVYLSDSDNNSSNRHSPGRAAAASPPPARVNRPKMSALLGVRPEEPLTKSRSLAFVITAAAAAEGQGNRKGGGSTASAVTKTKGFWARLMPGKASRRRIDGEAADIAAGLHSKTVKETASARWVL